MSKTQHITWLPAKCNLCGKWEHTERVCVKNGKEKRKRVDSKDSSGVKGVKEVFLDEKEKEQVNLEIEKGSQQEQVEKSVSRPQESNVSNWSLVSPIKVGRSQTLQDHAPEIQISASKFSVLVVENEDVEEGEYIEDNLANNEERVWMLWS